MILDLIEKENLVLVVEDLVETIIFGADVSDSLHKKIEQTTF